MLNLELFLLGRLFHTDRQEEKATVGENGEFAFIDFRGVVHFE